MDATMVFPALAALLHLTLHHLEGVRVDDTWASNQQSAGLSISNVLAMLTENAHIIVRQGDSGSSNLVAVGMADAERSVDLAGAKPGHLDNACLFEECLCLVPFTAFPADNDIAERLTDIFQIIFRHMHNGIPQAL